MHDPNSWGATRPPVSCPGPLRRLLAPVLAGLLVLAPVAVPGPWATAQRVAQPNEIPDAVEPAPEPAPDADDADDADDAEAKAVITAWDGRPVPETWPLGVPIGLSAEESVVGDKARSVQWVVEPEWVNQNSRRRDNNRQIDIATGVKPKTIVVELRVAKSDTLDSTRVTIRVAADPDEPGPAPPVPPAPPGPSPPPPGPVPPTPPPPGPGEPLSDLATRIRDLALRDIPDIRARKNLLLGLAAVHATVADDVAKAVAGIPAYAHLKDPAAIVAETNSHNRAMVGTDREAFLPFFTHLRDQVLNPLKPTALATAGGHIQVWQDIAAGLRVAANSTTLRATISR